MMERLLVALILALIIWVGGLLFPNDFAAGMLHGYLVLPRWILGLFFDGFPIYACGSCSGCYDFGYIVGLSVTVTATHE